MIKEALWVGWMDGIGMVIIGHRSSKSTFGANNEALSQFCLRFQFANSKSICKL